MGQGVSSEEAKLLEVRGSIDHVVEQISANQDHEIFGKNFEIRLVVLRIGNEDRREQDSGKFV